MLINLLLLAASLGFLFLGAEGLVRGASSLARRLGMTPLAVGLTVVAFGTSAPELAVSIGAALDGQSAIAAGNVIGSNSFNVGMILGITALLCPIHVHLSVLKIDGPIMIGVSLMLCGLYYLSEIGRAAGGGLFVLLLAYLAMSFWLARREKAKEVEQEFEEGVPGATKSVGLDLLYIAGGLALLIIGSRLLVSSASEIGRSFGFSEAVIGLTVVAAGTSMPELATSLLAAIRRQPDIAVGNVIGSNIFNILGILGLTSLVAPVSLVEIQTIDMAVMLLLSIGLLPLLYTGRKLIRLEGVALLAVYLGYLGWLLAQVGT